MDLVQRKGLEEFEFTGFGSYYYQIKETLRLKPKNCLIVGQGDNVVPSILRGLKNENIEVDTFDIVEDLNPTYVGDIRQIDTIINKIYDVVLCCEVLEHLPYDEFAMCLKKLSKIQRNGLILSLPVFGLSGYVKVWTPKYIQFTIPISVRFYKPGKKVMCDEHYWEINDRYGTKKKDVISKIEETFTIEKYYRVKDVPYHMFFILINR